MDILNYWTLFKGTAYVQSLYAFMDMTKFEGAKKSSS